MPSEFTAQRKRSCQFPPLLDVTTEYLNASHGIYLSGGNHRSQVLIVKSALLVAQWRYQTKDRGLCACQALIPPQSNVVRMLLHVRVASTNVFDQTSHVPCRELHAIAQMHVLNALTGKIQGAQEQMILLS